MKTLVTGASGFLGRHLSARLKKEGHEVVELSSKNCDLTDKSNLRKFNDIKYDRIFHLAAWTQAGDFCLRHPAEQWINNQQINTNVLSWWREEQPQSKMIAMGSSCCYDPELELNEKNFMVGTPIDSLYTYAMTKRMLYLGLQMMNRQFGMDYLCLVPSTLYGTGYHTGGKQMHFIFDLIKKIVDGKEKGKDVVLWGDGSQVRELIHVDDFINAGLILSERVNNEVVNIGAGRGQSIREFAEIICDIVGYDSSKIKYDTSRYVGAKSKVLDTRKLHRLMPEFKQRPLKEGLREVVLEYQERLNGSKV